MDEIKEIIEFVRTAAIKSFQDDGSEYRYKTLYLEYEKSPEPIFYLAKDEPGKDQYHVKDYMDKYGQLWMMELICDITDGIVKRLGYIKNN